MGPVLRLAQFIPGAADNHVVAEINKVSQHLFQVENLWLAVYQRQQDDAVGILELGMLVEIIQNYLRDRVTLHFNNQTDAVLVRLIPDITDAVQLLGTY